MRTGEVAMPRAYRQNSKVLYGGTGGQAFDDYFRFGRPDELWISSLQVNVGDTIDHVVVNYALTGTPDMHPLQHGSSNGGTVLPPFVIDIDNGELLFKVEVYFDSFNRTFQISGLRFTTIQTDYRSGEFKFRTSDLYGSDTGPTYISLQAPLGQGCICAFWGRQGLFFDAIGIYVMPKA
jgi:hypothetical protein